MRVAAKVTLDRLGGTGMTKYWTGCCARGLLSYVFRFVYDLLRLFQFIPSTLLFVPLFFLIGVFFKISYGAIV